MRMIETRGTQVKNKKDWLGFEGRVLVLSDEDLTKLDWILCGQDVDIFIVPKSVTDEQVYALEGYMANENSEIIKI